MVKKVAGNDRESGWNLEWEEEKRRGRKRGEEEEEEGAVFGGMRLNDSLLPSLPEVFQQLLHVVVQFSLVIA
jgi:hypothetical protein